MKKSLTIIIALLLICGAVHSKAKKIHPKELFDHDAHTKIFKSNKVPCETCHINEQYEWKGMAHDGCHKCHNSSKPLVAAPQDCAMCHAAWPVKPPNHKVNWISQHKAEAKLNPGECKNCHNDRFCIKCHEQRSTIELNMHKRNYRYFHSIDARADPAKCDRCHTVGYCTKCHTNPRWR